MKVKTKVLSAFLKKVRMNGSQQLTEAVLNFSKEGLKVNANNETKQARVMGWLQTSVFSDYEELGIVGLNDLENVSKVLDRFGEKLALKKEGNLLTISGDAKKVEIELVSEGFLATDVGEPELQFDDTFVIPATKLKEIFNDVKINKDAILTLETADKMVKFSNTGKYKFHTEVAAPTCKGGTKVKFGEPFIDAVVNLDGNLEISVKSDYPAKVMEKTDVSVVTIIAAPRVEEEE